jgi:hypothetical protein
MTLLRYFALPTVTFTAPADLCIDAGIQSGLGSGTALVVSILELGD